MSIEWRRHGALGDLRVLSDDVICRILGKLEVQDVTRLACVSSVFYIFCNDEPLWMRLCMSEPPETAIVYKGTWRQTALTRLAERLKVEPPDIKPPRRFEGFSSLHLYRQWYRCHIDLHTFSFDTGHVDRISDGSASESFQKYDNKKPLLLTDLLSSWPASKSWTLPKLVERFGDVKFKVSQAHGKAVKMSLRNYATYASLQHDEEPLYIFDPNFGESASPLLSDYKVPPLFGEDFLALLSGGLRPPYRWLVLGPPRSGAGWHVDPSLTSAWNALLTGKKRWAFYPPGKVPPGVVLRISEDDGDISFDGPPSLQWWLDVYPHIKPEDRPLECTQLPGETIFVPSGWWHCVLNIENSIAVTQNFMNEANFEAVLCDLAPGFHHRGLARAGGLAEKRSVHPSPDRLLSPADTAYQHFSDQGGDYISKQALRELLRKMWHTKLKLRSRLWKCACKSVGADHWQKLLGLICKRHGMEAATRGESLPLSGGRSAVFRVGSRIVKVFISEREDDVLEEGPLKSGAEAASVKGQETGKLKSCSNGDHFDGNASGREEGETRVGDCEKGSESGRGQEEMFRTEVLLHELIRTSKSPLQDAVPTLLGHGVVSESKSGEFVLSSTADLSSPEEEGQLRNGSENGSCQSKRSNSTVKALKSLAAANCKQTIESSSRHVTSNDVYSNEEKRRWLYVISEDCGGRQLGELYDGLSKGELLELARFLGRQVALIQALPLSNEGLKLEGATPLDPSAKDPAQGLPDAKRRKVDNGHQVETEAKRPEIEREPLAQLTSSIRQQVVPPFSSQSAVKTKSESSPSKESDPPTKAKRVDDVEHAKPPPSVELPSLEELGVPPKWRPFAAFLRAQREDLTERLTELGLPKPLLETVEAYVPRDPVDLLTFEKDPVWLHTDLLPDNILLKPLERGAREGEQSAEVKVKSRANGNGHAKETNGREVPDGVQLETSGTCMGAHILDFADARMGDPLYEIASLHVGTFRGDSQLLAAFLEAAPFQSGTEALHDGSSQKHHNSTTARKLLPSSYRAMCYIVLHEINLLHILLQRRPSALTDCLTWQQLGDSLWSKLDQEDPERVM